MKLRALLLVLGFPVLASASVGQDSASVATDCETLKGTLSATSDSHMVCKTTGYTVDFLLKNNQVTHIVWHGRTTPPLNVLLGSYTPEYKAALKASPVTTIAGTRKLRHQTQNLDVKRSGNGRLHMGEITLRGQQ